MMPRTSPFCASSRRSSQRHTHSRQLSAPSIRPKRGVTRPPHAVPDSHDHEIVSCVREDRQLSGQRVAQREDAPASQLLEQSCASVTWLLSGTQPRHALRDVLSRSPNLPGGKAGGWLAAASVVLFVGKGIHWGLVNRCRSCRTCRGYGIKRCNLCGASGAISWTGKWNHIEPCPACVGMRFLSCPDCGGLYHRPLFQHVSRNAGLQASQDQALTTVDVISPLVD